MNRLYFYRSLITRLRQYLISKSGTNPVTLTNAIEDKLLQGFSVTGDSSQASAPSVESPIPIQTTELKKSSNLLNVENFLLNKDWNNNTNSNLASIHIACSPNSTYSFFYDSEYVGKVYWLVEKESAEATTLVNSHSMTTTDSISLVTNKNTNILTVTLMPDEMSFDYIDKMRLCVTKLENNFDISKITNTTRITNNGDSLSLNIPETTIYSATSTQTLHDVCPTLNVGDNVITNLTMTNDVGTYNAFSSPVAYIYLATSKRTFSAGVVNTLTQDDLNSKILFYTKSYGATAPTENKATISNISMSKIPTNYEPYGKYGLEIKQDGQNYFNVASFSYLYGNSTYYSLNDNGELVQKAKDYRDISSLPVVTTIPAGTYTFKSTNAMSNFYLVDLTQNKVINLTSTGQFTVYGETNIGFKSCMEVNTVIGKLQLEQGTEASTYTPYQPPKYSRIWIDRPLLGKTDKLTYDGTNLKTINKEFKINLKDDVVWSYIEPTESGSIGTIQGVVNRSSDLYGTLLSNTTQSYLCTHYDSSFFDISRKHIDDGSASATRNTVLTFNGLQTDYDSFMEVINTGNVEMLIKYVNNLVAEQTQFTKTITSSSYIDLQPLSAGNNTLTVTNEISPTSCQYKYYSSKEN